jgi:hypothetical protein
MRLISSIESPDSLKNHVSTPQELRKISDSLINGNLGLNAAVLPSQSNPSRCSYLEVLVTSPAIKPPLTLTRISPITILFGHCFRCLAKNDKRKDCREPLRCKACLQFSHSSEVCKRNLSVNSLSIMPHISDLKHLCLAIGSMGFKSNLLAGLDRHQKEYSGSPIMHHPSMDQLPFPLLLNLSKLKQSISLTSNALKT